ncbi:hypothetical protein E4L96_11570 [Massilia arenosa]|uniref:Uncharacterized protein n=1 Tax=Zemynaea arenosa TaxID=2561931 RepID=A0A4Y9SF78_9BURK|nr:hypothetical protein [Massilia arenosa]TFW19633.1 hypothetical protein E4L96_11570 [Massilia arenosa]
MKYTLAAVFADLDPAQRARTALQRGGFAPAELSLSSRSTSHAWAAQESLGGRIANWFLRLLERGGEVYPRDTPDRGQGRSVLTVTCDSQARLDQAHAIIAAFSPIESDQQAGTGSPYIG